MLYKLKIPGTFTLDRTGEKFLMNTGAIFFLLHRVNENPTRNTIMLAPFGAVYSLAFPDETFEDCFEEFSANA